MTDENIVYGVHAVLAALNREKSDIQQLWVDGARKDPRIRTLLSVAVERGISVKTTTQHELEEWVPGVRHQGVVARCKAPPVYGESELEVLLMSLTEPAFLLVLDGVQDPHNLGACLRSADGAGVHAVIAPQDRSASLTHVVRKVASGAAESVPFVQVTNLARTLRLLQREGVWLVGAAAEGETSIHETDLSGPTALILGGEAEGLRRLTREHCHVLAHIPMAGTVSSLNVSVAAGICLFEAVRQRAKTKGHST
jgi:23S rRNA (guanosine2251-2'-O)-methyltransferase